MSNTRMTFRSDNRPHSLSKAELQMMSLAEIQAHQEDVSEYNLLLGLGAPEKKNPTKK